MDPTRTTVVGIFDEASQAERAVEALHTAGFSEEQIGFIRRDGETASGTTTIVETAPAHTGSGIATGAVIGGLLGAAAALLIPGVGPVLAGGLLLHNVGATAVGGAVAGAVGGVVAGGLIGALTDLGVPDDEARYADEQFQAGRTLVTVKAPGRAGEATEILNRYGAHDIHAEPSAAAAPLAASTTGATTAPVARPVMAENPVEKRMDAEKEAMQEQQPVSGTVRREQVNVERTGTTGTSAARSWMEMMPSYRSRWQSRRGTSGGRWEDVEPAYRFGYESSSMPAYKGQSWAQAEANLSRDWAARDPRTPWEKVKDSIRDSWNAVTP